MKRWKLPFALLLIACFGGLLVTHSLLQGQQAKLAEARTLAGERTTYRDVVKKILPAVVSIESRAKVVTTRTKSPRVQALPPEVQNQLPEEFRRFFKDLPFKDMPTPEPSENPSRLGFGSGFLVDAKGVILTNNHVVDGADELEVRLQDGRKFITSDIKTDPKTDLAIVKIKSKDPLPYLEFADSNSMEIGDRVLAVGAPFGLVGSVTHGIISGKGRNLHMNMYEDFLQTDAAINPGNSGGPLVNLEGKVVGINTAIKSRSGGFQGVGLAISSHLAQHIMEQLLKNGVVHRGYLGVQVKDLTDPDLAARLGLQKDQHGVIVATVFDKTPAAKAGLKDGDVIVSLDRKEIKDGRELQHVVADLPLHKPVEVALIRDGKPMTLSLTIEEQPATFGSAGAPAPRTPSKGQEPISVDQIGVHVTDMTEELASALGYKQKMTGALIMEVNPGSLADEAGLRRGMMITKVDSTPVNSAALFHNTMEKVSLAKGVLLQVYSPDGGTSFVLLKKT